MSPLEILALANLAFGLTAYACVRVADRFDAEFASTNYPADRDEGNDGGATAARSSEVPL